MAEVISKAQALDMFHRRLGDFDQSAPTRDAIMNLRSDGNATIRSLSISYGEQHDALRMTLSDFRRHLARIVTREKKKEAESQGDEEQRRPSDTPTVVGQDTIVEEPKE